MPKLLPTVMIALSVLASVVYFCSGDIRRGIYWIAASVLMASVTY